SISATDTPHHVNSGIPKCPMEVGQTSIVVAGQITQTRSEALTLHNTEAQHCEVADGIGQLVVGGGATGRDQCDSSACAQT
ncbi:MAG: hypothetical protein RIQ78_350, partial [Bacteroidota bacterium]